MSSLKIWINATRPKTLPASLSPVIIGSSIAYYHNSFDLFYFILISIIALLIQICTNFINELYDFKKGADSTNRLGPTRAVASGLIDYKKMKFVSALLIIITFALGMILVWKSGWIILAIGLSSLFFAWAYTGGPYPLAYNGWAEPAVLIFFGIFAVNGTYFIFTDKFDYIPFFASLMPGFLSTNLLLVNNIRDIETDKIVNKNTLAVKLGRNYSNHLYLIIHFFTLLVPFYLALYLDSFIMLLPLILISFHIKCAKNTYFFNGRDLNTVLAMNGILILLNGILTALAFILIKNYG